MLLKWQKWCCFCVCKQCPHSRMLLFLFTLLWLFWNWILDLEETEISPHYYNANIQWISISNMCMLYCVDPNQLRIALKNVDVLSHIRCLLNLYDDQATEIRLDRRLKFLKIKKECTKVVYSNLSHFFKPSNAEYETCWNTNNTPNKNRIFAGQYAMILPWWIKMRQTEKEIIV